MDARVFVEPQEGSTYEALHASATVAEACGFSGFFCSDHYVSQGGGRGLPGPCDAWTVLAGLSRETISIRLGTLVSPATFRSPGQLAVISAQVDAMSGGRIELGLGAGWCADEHMACGIPFPSGRERFARLEEQLDILTAWWSLPAGQSLSYSGRHYQLTNSPALPKPVRPSGLPLILGGRGNRRTVQLAARFATEYNVPFTDAAQARDLFRRFDHACAHYGRDPRRLERSVVVNICCGETSAELNRRQLLVQGLRGAYRPDGVCWGKPGDVVDQVSAYAEAGAGRIYLQFLDLFDTDHLKLVATEVLPRLP
ncbi:TIGR03560 family F420-dependent LLM class oxidoreductase [Streptomyces sp. OE57]|uniref:TIGR03560 family F420-dependent LLM class oxidoreductase n=1 Tax=Streptomyces lacaronensis TaxID=3379885 RepID=UPI0039B76348